MREPVTTTPRAPFVCIPSLPLLFFYFSRNCVVDWCCSVGHLAELIRHARAEAQRRRCRPQLRPRQKHVQLIRGRSRLNAAANDPPEATALFHFLLLFFFPSLRQTAARTRESESVYSECIEANKEGNENRNRLIKRGEKGCT